MKYKDFLKKILAGLKFSAPTLLNSGDMPLRFLIANELFKNLPNQVVLLGSYNTIVTAEMFVVMPLTVPIDPFVGVIMAQVVGEKKAEEINNKYNSLRQISLLLSIAPSLIMPLLLPPLFERFGFSEEMVDISRQYYIYRGGTLFIECLTNAQRLIAIALDNQWHTVASMFIGLGIFAGSGYLLRDPELNLNCAMIALGLACNNLFQAAYFELYHRLSSKNDITHAFKIHLSELKSTLKELFHLSWSIMISNVVYFSSNLGRIFILKISGDTAILIDGLSTTYTGFSSSLSLGFSRLNSVSAAHAVGENKLSTIVTDLKYSILMVSFLNTIWMSALPFVSGAQYANLILDDLMLSNEVGAGLKTYLLYASAAAFADAICMCLAGILNGLEDTKATALIDGISSFLSVTLPILLVNFTDLGEDSVPLGWLIAKAVASVFYGLRYALKQAPKLSAPILPRVEEVSYEVIPEVEGQTVLHVANHPGAFFTNENTRLLSVSKGPDAS